MRTIGDELAVFSFGKLQDLVTLLNLIEERGITVEEVRNYVSKEREKMEFRTAAIQKLTEKRMMEWEKIAKRCPECGSVLALSPINAPQGKANIHGYKSLWFCPKGDCIYEKFEKKSVKKILKELRR